MTNDQDATLHRNPWFQVRTKPFRGALFYGVEFHRECVCAVVVDRVGRVALVREERPILGGAVWDVPAGVLDDGEHPSDGAVREASEELGLAPSCVRDCRYLAGVWMSPGSTNQRMHICVVTVDNVGGVDTGAHEFQGFRGEWIHRVVWLPVGDAMALIATEGTSAHCLAAIALHAGGG